jgi:hypothetical protein
MSNNQFRIFLAPSAGEACSNFCRHNQQIKAFFCFFDFRPEFTFSTSTTISSSSCRATVKVYKYFRSCSVLTALWNILHHPQGSLEPGKQLRSEMVFSLSEGFFPRLPRLVLLKTYSKEG